MNILKWLRYKLIVGTNNQIRLFLLWMPLFLVIGFLLSKYFFLASAAWCLFYAYILLGFYQDQEYRPAFPYASKYPRLNVMVHSFYCSWALMGFFGYSLNQFIFE